MRKGPRFDLAAGHARMVLRDLGVSRLPVDPEWIAREHRVLVQAKPTGSRGVSGMLIKSGDDFAIAYATHIASPGFQRFSIAHELGHFFMPDHPEALFRTGPVHESRAGFSSGDNIELEADHFAAALLMPKLPFLQEVRAQNTENLELILKMADVCRTSRTATAIRYVKLTDHPMALVVSSGSRIEYCFLSVSLRAVPGLEWSRKGSMLPLGSATSAFNRHCGNVLNGARKDDVTSLSDWFGGRWDIECLEEVQGLGAYQKTLTIITPVKDLDIEELLEEEELVDSWTPTFRR
ncbi:MAG: ImmA/IrrE family metallo-endopeptidase [Wenzhouxiangellaceae bacterium]